MMRRYPDPTAGAIAPAHDPGNRFRDAPPRLRVTVVLDGGALLALKDHPLAQHEALPDEHYALAIQRGIAALRDANIEAVDGPAYDSLPVPGEALQADDVAPRMPWLSGREAASAALIGATVGGVVGTLASLVVS